jgi:hypothetical protein
MKSKTNRMSLKSAVSVLSMLMLTPVLRATELTPWDAMRGTYSGDITITANTGKQFKGTGGVFFTPDAVNFAGVSHLRGDVREVVIRRPRTVCCEPLAIGIAPLVLVAQAIGGPDFLKSAIPAIGFFSPVILGMAAVTGPPLFIIEGIRRLKPAQILYRVVP